VRFESQGLSYGRVNLDLNFVSLHIFVFVFEIQNISLIYMDFVWIIFSFLIMSRTLDSLSGQLIRLMSSVCPYTTIENVDVRMPKQYREINPLVFPTLRFRVNICFYFRFFSTGTLQD
jgi:hypothetical protein